MLDGTVRPQAELWTPGRFWQLGPVLPQAASDGLTRGPSAHSCRPSEKMQTAALSPKPVSTKLCTSPGKETQAGRASQGSYG